METDEENEVDATTVFVQAATNLTKVTSLDGILERFGYSKDDRINRRELVLMYKAVEKEMESEIFRLANTAYYDEAKEMRARLTRLRAEFDHLQTNGVAVTHLDQATNMEKATKELKRQVKTKHTSQVEAVQKRCEDLIADQNHFHEIEWENLELAISKIHRPPMKYSKRLIELMKAEHELIKLQQYEDARKVRRMIDRILPGEESRFNAAFDAMIELKRTRLRQRQEVEKLQLEEKTKAITWTDIRARELESNTLVHVSLSVCPSVSIYLSLLFLYVLQARTKNKESREGYVSFSFG